MHRNSNITGNPISTFHNAGTLNFWHLEDVDNQHCFSYKNTFTFTGKERDEETGFGYFGAHYMDHELMTMWLSVDPLADKYPSISPYAYCNWKLTDLMWDPMGNLAQVNKVSGCYVKESRFLFWTEDSRLVGVVDDNFYSYYAYGHDGERALKLAGKNSQIDVNAVTYTCQALLDDATLYPSPYLVASRKGYTKHYYAGTERLCAKTGDGGLDRFGTFQCTDTTLSNRALRLFKDCNSAMLSRQLQANDGPSVEAVCGKTPIELQEKVKDVPVHVDATVSFDLSDFRKAMSNYAGHLQPYGEETFYYHGDHLGSASWITDKNGIPVQHLQYLPFGEPYVSQHAGGGYEERFTFTAKERDTETGYGYFGARYYDPDISALWLSVDPMADKYPGISPYAYCAWNPVRLVDPDGQIITDFLDAKGNMVKHVEDGSDVVFQQTGTGPNLHYEYKSGNDYGRKDVFASAIQAQQELNFNNDALKQKQEGGTTHCNQAVKNVMKMINSIPGINGALIEGLANDMMETLISGGNPYYYEVSENEAVSNATDGGFSIVGYKAPKNKDGKYSESGHVAAYAVNSKNPKDALIANIGPIKLTGYKTINYVISKNKEKHFFVFSPVPQKTKK